MENLDRAGWADALMFISFGVRIGIRVSQPKFADPKFTDSLERVLPPGYKATRSTAVHRMYSLVVGEPDYEREPHRLNVLYDGAERLIRKRELAPVLKVLETEIRHRVAEMAPRRVFVHAGVVEYRGRALVIPGTSMSGKSTLVSELIRHGATYYSDEYAVLDDKGMVYPFAKPLSIRRPGSFDAIDYDVEHFGATTGEKSVPIGLVIVTRYAATRDGVGSGWRPRKLTSGQGALALLAHCIAARREPQRVMTTLRNALAKALILKGTRGEASELAPQLLETLERGSEHRTVGPEFRNVDRKG